MSKMLDRLEKQLAPHGATIDRCGMFFCLDAPSGYLWVANGSTSISVTHENHGGQTWMADAIKDAVNQIRDGLAKEDDPAEIERLRFEMDEDWGAPDGAPDFIDLSHIRVR
jgi:hypothetical protein